VKTLLTLTLSLALVGCAGIGHQTTPDVNYWSYSGAADGSLVLTNPDNPAGLLLRSGPLPIYEIPSVVIDLPALGVDASKYNDILKFSRAINMRIDQVTVKTGGTQIEQAIDMNNLCQNITIVRADIQEGKENALTIKGGCNNIHFGVLSITPGTGHCDIELGGASDQSNLPTTEVTMDSAAMTDGNPVKLRILNATPPDIAQGNVIIGLFL
jgi:DNA-binding protein